MRRASQGRAVRSGVLTILQGILLMIATSGCLPRTIESFHFCGRMLYSFSGIVRSGTAEYRVKWVANGVDYDSDYYGAPTAEIDRQGWACFHGGVGHPIDIEDFELKSLTVKVRDVQGRELTGAGSHLKWEFRKNTRAFHAWGNFELALARQEPQSPVMPSVPLVPLVIDEDRELDGDAVGGAQSLIP